MPTTLNRRDNPARQDRRNWNGHDVDANLQDVWLERLNKLNNFSLTSICEGHVGERRGLRGTPHLILRLQSGYHSLLVSTWHKIRPVIYAGFTCDQDINLCKVSIELTSKIRLNRGASQSSDDKLLIRIEATNHRTVNEPKAWLVDFLSQSVILAETLDRFFGEILAKEKQVMIESVKYIPGAFLKFRYGIKCPIVLIDAVHAAKPMADMYTGKVVEAVAKKTGCHAIIATISREVANINRPPSPSEGNAAAVEEYRRTIRHLYESTGILNGGNLYQPVLHLAIHGMKNRLDADIELGTCSGRSCSDEVLEWVKMEIEEWGQNTVSLSRKPTLVENRKLSGDKSKTFHRRGDHQGLYLGYGEMFNTVQIEFAYWLRKNHRKEIVSLLATIADKFQVKYISGGSQHSRRDG